ncbi:hypothetical protein E3P99_03194 [Wallemia hederae]|uniref:Uncharacterized protein n=1 Tax=Wallemia hederae TaxID=1540922 RepID=A0A4T0FIP1_9BASI|nr:hypothetical protein E3P99_03194 [Wallemia hederae]
MNVGKEKKAPTTRDGSGTNGSSNSMGASLISRKTSKTVDEQLRRQIDSGIDNLGGMSAYQHASTLGQSATRGGDSSHVFVAWLQELRVREKLQRRDKMSLLEIGALKPDSYSNQRS